MVRVTTVFAVFCALLTLAAATEAAHYAVLVAGSNEFYNYRHQTDIAHAYNILLNHGVPAANIITFMYDDIASSSENPYPGQLFNKPTPKGVKGFDVYAAIKGKIDYTGKDVTPANFLHVIKGEAAAMKGIGSGKVLNSTADDMVFINFSDHGGTDIICFPSEDLAKDDLIAAFKYMHQKQMYGKMVFYLEACESGSMFDKVLTTDLNIYATTAANPDESSYGWYCDNDSVDGVSIGSCLGDHYSISWMEDADLPSVANETLQQQFIKVQNLTNDSHVMQYGNISPYKNLPVLMFQGNKDGENEESEEAVAVKTQPAYTPFKERGVAAADAKLHSLYRRYMLNSAADANSELTQKLAQQLAEEVQLRTKMDTVFATLTQQFGGQAALKNKATAYPASKARTACYRRVLAAFRDKCGRNDYSIKYVRVLSNMCAHAVKHMTPVRRLVSAVEKVCMA